MLVTKLPIDVTDGSIKVGVHLQNDIKCRRLDLKKFKTFDKSFLFEHVKFNPLPISSFKYIQTRIIDPETGKMSSKMTYYRNLLQLDIVNMSVLYHLDSKSAQWEKDAKWEDVKDDLTQQYIDFEEIDMLTSVDLITKPELFVNTGFDLRTSYSAWDDNDKRNCIEKSVLTDETKSLCFSRTSTLVCDDQKVGKTNIEFSRIFRTFSELDLFELQRIQR